MSSKARDRAPGEPYRPLPPHHRLALDGRSHVVTHGLQAHFWQDIYHRALTVRWPVFFAFAALFFLALNLGFALLFQLGRHAIANQSPPGLLGAFFFSVETLATVGYGDMHPDTIYGHTIATCEIFVGMSGIALTTGMIFARFSRPHARILFAERVVVRQIDGRLTLMVRAANARQNVIVEAKARMRLMRSETSAEGFFLRKVHDLQLTRDQHPIFLLSWTLMHVIDENSPLHGQTLETLEASKAELMLMVEGMDETTMQPMQARHAWRPEAIFWQHRYVDLLREHDGETHLDYGTFHDVLPL
jgi:inward rectifier potassium channel